MKRGYDDRRQALNLDRSKVKRVLDCFVLIYNNGSQRMLWPDG